MAARLLMVAGLALALAGCAAPTPYQPSWMGDGYGYSEQRIEPDRYRVTFAGNAAMPRETLENYVLFRAAELTLGQGGDWFTVTARGMTQDYGGGRGVSTGVGIGGGSRSGVSVGLGIGLPLGGGGGGGPREATAEIVIHRGAKPDDAPDAFDARAVHRTLAPRVLRPGA